MGVHIGTSGWSYDHWHGVLYPHGIPPRDRLAYYTASFGTVELNASHYRWPASASFRSWQRRTPPGFLMSVKAHRGLTHAKKLYGPERWVERMSSAWHELGDTRAVMLVQLPPGFPRDDARLTYFLRHIPEWMRVAVEFRHPSWVDDRVFGILEETNTAYCVMSGAGLPCVLRATSSTVYVRMHGPDHTYLYGGSYSDDDLRWWADRIAEWRDAGKDVFVYFNNDGDGNAVRNAWTLRDFVGEG